MSENQEWLDKLNEKYKSLGVDARPYLEGLYWAKPITYWDYVEIDTLLSLQKNRTGLEDEGVFIMYHQVNELLFKMILSEIKQIAYKEDLTPAFFATRLDRISRYFDVLTSSFEIMRLGMETEQYLKFRNTLTPASGFQSGQYRMIEICSTDFENLVDARFKDRITKDSSWEDKLEHIYWQAAGKDYKTGKKSLTLQLFEEKYRDQFLRTAEEYKNLNLWARYCELDEATQKDPQLLQAMRHHDHTVNIKWVMAHYNSAKHYLESGTEVKEATGGSDWKKYMHPKYQRRMFFPGVWSEDELARWGEDEPM
jgi:tryptophan 2,3-dioxygenase